MPEKISLCKGIVCVLAFLTVGLFASADLFAAETRGLRVVAKDPVSGQQTEVKLYNKSYAVIIGIDQYQNLSFSEQLTYAVRDAKGVEDVLRKNFKFDKIITLYNKQATKDNILKVLMEDMANELGEEDALFVFWAGHGNQEKTRTGDLGYLIPYDGFKAKLQSNISMNTLKEDISKKLAAKHVFYVMDACYGGLLTATRGLDKQTKRDLAYIQEITREPVRQVLTAGGKDQEVLDGGPKGHSVFTGRFIEELENAGDFITANELQAKVKEKVFSDARAQNRTQTPSYGTLYGMGDFVFIPSLAKKAEETQAAIAELEKEDQRLEAAIKAAISDRNEEARRKAERERRVVEARLKSEQMKQQAIETENRRKAAEERERIKEAEERARIKKAEDAKLALLQREVVEKRKSLKGAGLTMSSPEGVITELAAIDEKIKDIRDSYDKELMSARKSVLMRYEKELKNLSLLKKDEFETADEFKERAAQKREHIENIKRKEMNASEKCLNDEFDIQITPFRESIGDLAKRNVTLADAHLLLQLGIYDASSNVYPITLKIKPIKEFTIEIQANLPMDRDRARDFKKHFERHLLRPEIVGHFRSAHAMKVVRAFIVNDASNDTIDLFSSRFVRVGQELVVDSGTGITWNINANPLGKKVTWEEANAYIADLIKQNNFICTEWRLPREGDMEHMAKYGKDASYGSRDNPIANYLNNSGFVNVQAATYWTADSLSNRSGKILVANMRDGNVYFDEDYDVSHYLWPICAD